MSPNLAPWLTGAALTLVVHASLAFGLFRAGDGTREVRPLASGNRGRLAALLCDERRCGRLEARQRRRGLEEPPMRVPDFLEATVVPALGTIAPDPTRLPEIETFERPEVFEQSVNLDTQPSALDDIVKSDVKPDDKHVRKDTSLKELLSDEPADPRARAKDLSKLTGFKEGEIGGQGTEVRLGSLYSGRVAREVSRVFKVPPFLDPATLKTLKVKVLVERLGLDGAILGYRIRQKSGDKSFDDAAIAAVKQFVPSEGGSRTLPAPESDVLRYVNAKGLLITLDGALLRR
jgi:hypothetical protein